MVFLGGGGTGGKRSLLQAEKFKPGRTEMTESYEDDHNDHPSASGRGQEGMQGKGCVDGGCAGVGCASGGCWEKESGHESLLPRFS